MGSDMVVALARATADGNTLFGHNYNGTTGDEGPGLIREPGRDFAPGESTDATHVSLPQARHTHTVLTVKSRPEDRGYPHGVNEHGVAMGCTGIHTRLSSSEPGLTGPDLVRLGLERSDSARQAVEVLTDLIARHGQGGRDADQETGCSLLIADAQEAFVLEAAGRHWALGHVGQSRAVSAACMLRQDWDRISRGLADLAIEKGWWPEDGCKLDFAGALGVEGPDHRRAMRRWGQATLVLEHYSGSIGAESLRRLLRDLADSVSLHAGGGAEPTVASLIVEVGGPDAGLPVIWWAVGSPSASVYLPILQTGSLPAALTPDGAGCQLWRRVRAWQVEGRRDPELRAEVRAALAGLQQWLDTQAHEVMHDANDLHRRGRREELERLSQSFMEHWADHIDEVSSHLPGPAALARARSDEAALPLGAAF